MVKRFSVMEVTESPLFTHGHEHARAATLAVYHRIGDTPQIVAKTSVAILEGYNKIATDITIRSPPPTENTTKTISLEPSGCHESHWRDRQVSQPSSSIEPSARRHYTRVCRPRCGNFRKSLRVGGVTRSTTGQLGRIVFHIVRGVAPQVDRAWIPGRSIFRVS